MYLEFTGDALDVCPSRCSKSRDWSAVRSDEFDTLFFGTTVTDLLLRTHRFDDVDSGAADVDTGSCQPKRRCLLDYCDVGLGVGTEQPVCEDATRYASARDEDVEFRHAGKMYPEPRAGLLRGRAMKKEM